MTKTLPTIVFFGNERLATGITTDAPVLRHLIEWGYPIAAVVINNHQVQSRSKQQEFEVVNVAQQHGIPVLTPQKLPDITDQLRSFDATAGILLAYGKIIPQSIIDIFPRGIINLHPSLLPKHRGSTPIESVILQAENTTGLSLMALSRDMDAGPVYAQSNLQLTGNESKQTIYSQLITQGINLLKSQLPAILDGTLVPIEQDHARATYDERLHKQSGAVDWSLIASVIERRVRAYEDWPKVHARLGSLDIVITKAHVVGSDDVHMLQDLLDSQHQDAPRASNILGWSLGQVLVHQKRLFVRCADTMLEITELTPRGKSSMNAASFVNGYANKIS